MSSTQHYMSCPVGATDIRGQDRGKNSRYEYPLYCNANSIYITWYRQWGSMNIHQVRIYNINDLNRADYQMSMGSFAQIIDYFELKVLRKQLSMIWSLSKNIKLDTVNMRWSSCTLLTGGYHTHTSRLVFLGSKSKYSFLLQQQY